MAQWEAMRECFCILWFRRNDSNNSSSNSGRHVQSDVDTTNTSTSSDQPCSSLLDIFAGYRPSHASIVEEVLYTRVVVTICCFGLVGNAVNLVVLSARRYQAHTGRMQQFARIGLMALAVSDSLFCLSILPHAFVERDPFTSSVNFSLVFSAYGESVINVFAMIGTWLTVAMATGRYAAVCHPFQARAAIGRTVALRMIAVVSIACVVFNVPRFFRNSIETCPLWNDDDGGNPGNRIVYYRWFGPLHTSRHRDLELGYVWVYFLVSVMIPLVVLIFTGFRLACWLRRGRLDGAGAEERAAAAGDLGRFHDLDRSFTVTLVAVALMHVILVCPAELISFFRGHLLIPEYTDDSGYLIYNLIATVLNTLQAVNYSFNFLLYCAINVAFRRRFVELVSCRGEAATQNRLGMRMLAQSGMQTEWSVDSNGRRSVGQRRQATSDRGAVYRLAGSDYVN